MTDFKIDYQVGRDNKGQESVYRVYIPSAHKGWAIMADKEDAASARVEALQRDIFIKAEKPSEGHREPSVEDIRDMPVPKPLEFNAVNRVVLLSTLKSGQPPKKRPLAPKDSARVRAPGRDKVCPICGDCFTMDYRLEDHFVACVRRNGNPQGHFWNDALDNGKHIPWESDPKYRRRCEYKVKLNAVSGVVFPSKLKRGQSPIKSPYGSTARNRDQNRDKTCAICGDCFTTAYRLKCHFIHCVGRNGNPQGYYWNGALDDKRRIGNEKDEEVSLSVGDIPHISEEQRTQTSSKTAQHRGSQEHNLPLRYDGIKRAWVLTTPETAKQHENEANAIGTSGHDGIHGDFVDIPKTQRCHTISNAYTHLTPRDIGASRSSGPSKGSSMSSLTRSESHTDGQIYAPRLLLKPFPLLPSSGTKKRQLPSEPPPVFQGPKRQRMLPSEPANVLQAKTPTDPSRHFEKGPHFPSASAEGSALSLSRNEPTSGGKMDEHHVAMHHSKGAGIEASSKAAESAAPLPPRNEPMYEWYDYVKTHEDFRRELDNLVYKLDAANKRANTAELQSQNTDRLVNQAKEVGLAKLKMQEDDFKRAYRPLKIRCDALELSIAGKDDVIDKLRRELEQERQMPAILRSEHDKTVENLEIRAVVQ